MCGIFVTTDQEFDTPEVVRRLKHRGPDSQGIDTVGDVVFGHARLSIIDPTERSNQPFVSRSGKTTLVFNGEIYNYRELRGYLEGQGVAFRTEGDTEVVVEGYEREGAAFFNRLRGMWAFVLYDSSADTLVASRDPFGIKPLFYTLQNGNAFFVSELKALRGLLPLSPNPEAFAAFYTLGYFIAPHTPFKGVFKVRPGEVLVYDKKKKEITALAAVPRTLPATPVSGDPVTALDEALTDAVRAHYVADVPVSILLSGGNDSSLIAALSKKLGMRPTAHHVALPGSEDTYYAKEVAAALDLPLEIHELDQDALRAAYERAWEVMDEPTGDLSQIPTTLVFERIKGAKVVLSGEGGDELFGGYLRHQLTEKHTRLSGRSVLGDLLGSLLGTSATALTFWNPVINRVHNFLLTSGISNDLVGAYIKSTRLMDYPFDEAAVRAQLLELLKRDGHAGLPGTLALDALAYLPNDLLPKSDSASMASSIEARVPLVDRALVGVVSSLRERGQLPKTDKSHLRRVLQRYLPESLVYRSKKGFGVPLAAYDQRQFMDDFAKAAAFYRTNHAVFGMPDAVVRLIGTPGQRSVIARKYPRFAYALISNWKYFEVY